MSEMRHRSDESVRAYLLGTLDDREASELEAGYFTDPGRLERIRRAEQTLIEDYLKGRLAVADRERFELKYLKVPELAKTLEEVRERLLHAGPAPRAWSGSAFRLALVCAAVLLMIAASWRYARQPSPEILAVAKAPATGPSAFTVRLSPGVQMGARSKSVAFAVPPGTGKLEFSLELPGRTASLECSARFLAVGADGRQALVWKSPLIRSRTDGVVWRAVFEPEAKSLYPSDYLVQVEDADGRILETYIFRLDER